MAEHDSFMTGLVMVVFMLYLAVLIVAKTENASAYDGKRMDIEVVAGADPHQIAMALHEAAAEREQEEIELMAHLVYAENGTYLSRLYTGSVVLNRVHSDKFPDTLEGVIYQNGQYQCTWNGHIEREPDKMAYEVAEELIRNGSVIPEGVLYAAEFVQGKVFAKVDGTYYCYGGK